MTMNKVAWADLDEDDDNELDNTYLLPPKQVTGPDSNGVKTITEYKFNDLGEKVKVTTRTRVVKALVNKRVVERRSWAKFGDAANDDALGGGYTTVSTEVINLDRPGDDDKEKDSKKVVPNDSGQLKVCRNCNQKGDHWTRECPYKNLLEPSIDKLSLDSDATTSASTTKKYVAPRPTSSIDQRRKNDEGNTVRVTNLSEDAREDDLQELFEAFGRVTRAFVSLDRNTKLSRGFGFVTFARKQDAQRAIDKLNGYGYGNLILSAEWSAPRV